MSHAPSSQNSGPGNPAFEKSWGVAEEEFVSAINEFLANFADMPFEHFPVDVVAGASAMHAAISHIRTMRNFLAEGGCMKKLRCASSLGLSLPVNRFDDVASKFAPNGAWVGGAVARLLHAVVEHLVQTYARSCAIMAKVAKRKMVGEAQCEALHHVASGRFNFAARDAFMNDTKERSVLERVAKHPLDILDSHAKALLSKDTLLPKFSPGARAILRAKWCDVLHDLVHAAADSVFRDHPESPAITPVDVTRALNMKACAFGGQKKWAKRGPSAMALTLVRAQVPERPRDEMKEHAVYAIGEVVFCSACGAFSRTQALRPWLSRTKLTHSCPCQPRNAAAAKRRNRMCKGRDPHSDQWMGAPCRV